ncbi:MAG: hypothetical protein E7324_10440 [Clostridiales bacterium]|nr:hypothetical protein [Clostridiales bacterium]
MTTRKFGRTLLVAALALSLVLSITGGTIAWFTDSVESANNVITSGNLDVEVLANGESIQNKTTLFDDVSKWEPGAVAWENLTVVNKGNLALKYEMTVSTMNENTLNGKGLSSALQVGVIENGIAAGATREAVLSQVETWYDFNAFEDRGALQTKDAQKVHGIVVYWAPKANDNDWNVNNGKKADNGEDHLHIDLGVTVVATQLTYENDSFDNTYDENADYNGWANDAITSWYETNPSASEYVLNTADELAGLAKLVNAGNDFKGKTIKLGKSINLANRPWTAIGDWDHTFSGTFDGQGYTISNLYINDPAAEGTGLFGVAQNSTIKGINVKNANITGYSMVATIVGSPYTGCTISDCHVTGNVKLEAEWAYVGGIVGYGYTKIENCSMIATGTGTITSKTRNAVGGIAAWLLEDASSIKNCEVKNLDLTGWANIGAITGFMHRLGVIDGCSAENVTLTKTRADGIATIGLAAGGWNYNATKPITITNNTFKNITLNGTYVANAAADILYGGEYYGNTNSSFVTKNNKQESITNNLVEVSVISNVDQLEAAFANGGKYALANMVGDVENYTLALDADTTITVPAGKEVYLNLNGKTISSISDKTSGNVEQFLVKGNLTVVDGTMTISTSVNQGWNAMSTVFDITAGGVLNLEGVTVKNLGGTDMGFCIHMNNWGEVTLNMKDSVLESPYVALRVFNSGYDMNNVTIKNSKLTATNYAFWVHNFTAADHGSLEKAKTQAALLNLDMFGAEDGNTFVSLAKPNSLRYGMTNAIYADPADVVTNGYPSL